MRALLTILLLASTVVSAQAQQAAAGNPDEGRKRAEMCIGCHGIKGYQASFPEIYKVPMISGQGAGYLAAALTAYRKGDRKHPTRRAIATSLSDKDIADLAAFYSQHGGPVASAPPDGPAAPAADVAKLLERGACASCHGANFSKPIDPSYPKLAGQYGDYLYVALKSYKTEGNANVGRNNAIMSTQVKQFSLTELRVISEYLSSLPGEVRTVKESYFR
jgi:cytochrome c553